jgi:hypothetical protein
VSEDKRRRYDSTKGSREFCVKCNKSTFHYSVFAGKMEDDNPIRPMSRDGKIRLASGQCYECGNIRDYGPPFRSTVEVKPPLKVVPFNELPEWRSKSYLERGDKIADALVEYFSKEHAEDEASPPVSIDGSDILAPILQALFESRKKITKQSQLDRYREELLHLINSVVTECSKHTGICGMGVCVYNRSSKREKKEKTIQIDVVKPNRQAMAYKSFYYRVPLPFDMVSPNIISMPLTELECPTT